jgi:hypothetical protein
MIQSLPSGREIQINNLLGWLIFTIALATYYITMEDTASYWDPGEFIAVSYKLQVPHPPGAPLFLMLGRLFSFLSFGDPAQVARAINLVSVVASAFTIMFMYWSLVHFGRKLVTEHANSWLLYGAAASGALAYTFSDSFWFSAAEAEVYALSSFFTAFGIWAILKWQTIEDERRANRWLILIAYMMGLSAGVHLLNLLTIPVLALIYYFKKYSVTMRGVAIALSTGVAVLLSINSLVITGLPAVAGKFELYFVNSLGFSFGSGILAFGIIIVGALVYGIRYSHMKRSERWNTAALGLTFLIIGYGSYAAIVIRASYDTPINENAPKDVMSFVSYLKREQYGTWPILFGPYFSSRPVGYEYGAQKYKKGKDRYELAEREVDVEYKPGDQTLLPRAWDSRFADDYQRILGLNEGQRPTFAQNIAYMFEHQIGTMYVRYFMWNFAGRESDDQGARWLQPSQWFTELPPLLASNKARNNYFMIPFVLGLIGMFFQFTRDTKSFAVIGLLFFMLGLAIVLYLNSPPTEPRERDYIYAGSYYAYAMWIGIAIIAIGEGLNRFLRNRMVATTAALLMGTATAGVMAMEGWDDHDRSNRFFSTDAASNILKSCEKDGVIFTGGDNDTFPLWYAQDVEGCRPDMRVLVLSYCNTDWYIDQTLRKANQSAPFNYTIPLDEYRQGGPNDLLYYVDANIPSVEAKDYLTLLARQFKGLRVEGQNVLPTRLLTIKVDKEAIRKSGIVPIQLESLIVDEMELRVTAGRLEKNDLVFLDMLVSADWKRPVYVNPTSMAQLNIDVSPYAVQHGNAYRILPVRNPRTDRDYLVDTDRTYDLMINQFQYRELDNPDVYYTDDYKMQVMNHRSNLNALAEALADEGDAERASDVINFSLAKIPGNVIPYDPSFPDTVNLLYRLGENEKATSMAVNAWQAAHETATYLVAEESQITMELRRSVFMMDSMQRSLLLNGESALAGKMDEDYETLMAALQRKHDGD